MPDLLDFFKEVANAPYCVVKMSPTFPLYTRGEDVDIFCYSPADFTGRILAWGNSYVQDGYRIKVSEVHREEHVHVDLFQGDTLVFRFDLYGALPRYEKLLVKPALFESVIENAQVTRFQAGGEEVGVRVPATVDELLIRYLEFMEFYDVRPAKIKHLEYILEGSDAATREKLLAKLHHYTQLPPLRRPEPSLWGRLSQLLKRG